MNARNSLTITETKDILCAEHASRLFVAECWWAIVPSGDNNPLSYAATGDASAFWALINATRELGMPLGFDKVENHLGKLTNVAHNDPEKVLRSILKPQPRAVMPDRQIIETAPSTFREQTQKRCSQKRKPSTKPRSTQNSSASIRRSNAFCNKNRRPERRRRNCAPGGRSRCVLRRRGGFRRSPGCCRGCRRGRGTCRNCRTGTPVR